MTKSSARKAPAEKARVGAKKAHRTNRRAASKTVAEKACATYRKTAA